MTNCHTLRHTKEGRLNLLINEPVRRAAPPIRPSLGPRDSSADRSGERERTRPFRSARATAPRPARLGTPAVSRAIRLFSCAPVPNLDFLRLRMSETVVRYCRTTKITKVLSLDSAARPVYGRSETPMASNRSDRRRTGRSGNSGLDRDSPHHTSLYRGRSRRLHKDYIRITTITPYSGRA